MRSYIQNNDKEWAFQNKDKAVNQTPSHVRNKLCLGYILSCCPAIKLTGLKKKPVRIHAVRVRSEQVYTMHKPTFMCKCESVCPCTTYTRLLSEARLICCGCCCWDMDGWCCGCCDTDGCCCCQVVTLLGNSAPCGVKAWRAVRSALVSWYSTDMKKEGRDMGEGEN